MGVPKSVVKFKKNGITFESSVDKVIYTLHELSRAALRDVGRYVSRTSNSEAMKLPGMKRSYRVRGKSSAFQFWVRRQEADLQVGIKHGTWYGTDQELGTNNQPKRGILQNTVQENIPTIIQIESQYLSVLSDEAAALARVDEDEEVGEIE